MPTGVPLTGGPEQLFDAARRVLLRNGPDALTSRAVTSEAGVAKGVLHRYFVDFDAFLASLALAELERMDALSAELRALAGEGEVADALAGALEDALTPELIAIAELVVSRHPLLARLRLTTPNGIPLLAEVTRMVAAYLTAERGLGRIAIGTDVDGLALALVGGAHLLRAGGRDRAGNAGELRALVTTALAGAASDAEAPTRPSRPLRPPRRTRPGR